MNVNELIERVKVRAASPLRQTSVRAKSASSGILLDGVSSNLRSPAQLETVRDAERRMGLRLPPLLSRLYCEVGNGGFGPGYGLYGVTGGFADGQGLTLPELYLVETEYHWPAMLVPILRLGLHDGVCD